MGGVVLPVLGGAWTEAAVVGIRQAEHVRDDDPQLCDCLFPA